MIIRIFKLLIKSKIILQSPLETDLIIFDNVSINELKHILKNRSYFVLKSRPDKIDTIYISPKIIYFFLESFILFLFMYLIKFASRRLPTGWKFFTFILCFL